MLWLVSPLSPRITEPRLKYTFIWYIYVFINYILKNVTATGESVIINRYIKKTILLVE